VRKDWEYKQVYGQGIRLHGKGFSLIHCPNTLGRNRLGISISGKIKGSVKRNRMKRIIRESFRLNRQIYPQDADIVFTVRPDFVLNSPSAINKAVALLMSTAKGSHES
jgi:ribonuclease P protein component